MGLVLGSPEGEPKVFVWAFMPLRSLLRGGSCPGSGAYPTSCRLRGVVLLLPASALTCRREMRPPPAFFVALRAAIVPVGCSSAGTASARVETCSSTASLRSRPAPAPQHPPASSLSVSRRLVPLSVV